MKVNSQVTPSLHPQRIVAIKGYDDSTAGYVDHAKDALSKTYSALASIHAARVQVSKNTAWPKDKQLLEVANFAEKNMDSILAQFDKTRKSLETAIEFTTGELAKGLNQVTTSYANEIRAHVKALPRSERAELIQGLIQSKSFDSLSAVLNAPSFLSGLEAAEHKHYIRQAQEAINPDLVKRMNVMKSALEVIDGSSVLVFGEVEKAIGAKFDLVKKVRETENASQRALILKDFGKEDLA